MEEVESRLHVKRRLPSEEKVPERIGPLWRGGTFEFGLCDESTLIGPQFIGYVGWGGGL